MIKLSGKIQDYAWGKSSESIIHQRFGLSNDSNRYAELWFGSHVNGDSLVNGSKMLLKEYLQANPDFLGKNLQQKFFNNLPFLFKILSVGQALSIQLHPNLEQAGQLHQTNPQHYPDPYPKPEAGIAITPVQILYGFRPLNEISKFLDKNNPEHCPELIEINSDSELSYQELTRQVLSLDQVTITRLSNTLWDRLAKKEDLVDFEIELLKLKDLYPKGDRGVFFFYILNFVTLTPGQGLFIDANIMHAYLAGELVEIMAPSDNVLRAGLTAKYIDLENTIAMTNFSETLPKLIAAEEQANHLHFPIPENPYFALSSFKNIRDTVQKNSDVQLIFCLEGKARLEANNSQINLKAGEAALLGFNTKEYQLNAENSLIYVANSTI